MFPLYNQLLESLDDNLHEFNPDDKEFFISTVKSCTEKEHEIMYALIRSHQLQDIESKLFYILPYNAKNQKKGIKFDFNNLPLELQHLLTKFIKLHLENV